MAKFGLIGFAVIWPSILCFTTYEISKMNFDASCRNILSVNQIEAAIACFTESQREGEFLYDEKTLYKWCSHLTNGHDLGTVEGKFKGICQKDYAKGKTKKDMILCYIKAVEKFSGKEKARLTIQKAFHLTLKCVGEGLKSNSKTNATSA